MGKLNYKLVESGKELAEAFKVRKEVFVEEQGISEDIELDSNDSEALHIVVKDGERVIGTARVLFPAQGVAKIERMAILRPFRRKGIGSRIISFLNTELKNRQIRKVVLHAQYSSVAFYKSCGFAESGMPFNEAGIRHLRMEREL
jgi:predicted GNAT family N-acyltransferase